MARVSNTQSKVISGALVTGREYYADNMLRRTSFLLLAGMCLAAAAVPAESDDGGFAATQIAVEPAVPVARDGLVTMQVVTEPSDWSSCTWKLDGETVCVFHQPAEDGEDGGEDNDDDDVDIYTCLNDVESDLYQGGEDHGNKTCQLEVAEFSENLSGWWEVIVEDAEGSNVTRSANVFSARPPRVEVLYGSDDSQLDILYATVNKSFALGCKAEYGIPKVTSFKWTVNGSDADASVGFDPGEPSEYGGEDNYAYPFLRQSATFMLPEAITYQLRCEAVVEKGNNDTDDDWIFVHTSEDSGAVDVQIAAGVIALGAAVAIAAGAS